jgi:hypothetical protein
MTRTHGEARVAEAKRLYRLGLGTRAVAAQMEVDPRTVGRWLGDETRRPGPRQRAGVTDRRILELRTVRPDPEREAKGLPPRRPMPFAEIGRLVGMSKTGVRMRYYALTGRPRPDRS